MKFALTQIYIGLLRALGMGVLLEVLRLLYRRNP